MGANLAYKIAIGKKSNDLRAVRKQNDNQSDSELGWHKTIGKTSVSQTSKFQDRDMKTSHAKNMEIEALRGLAILLVVFHHRDLLLFWGSEMSRLIWRNFTFWPGVDLFFVISGFVISKDFIPKVANAQGSSMKRRILTAFYVRRMFRLWPAAWTWLAVTLIFTALSNVSGAWESWQVNISGAKAAVFQYYNYFEYWCNNHGGCSANAVYWSLSLEEQFYFLYPLLIIFFGANLSYLIVSAIVYQVLWNREVWSLPWAFRTDALFIGVFVFLAAKTRLPVSPGFKSISRYAISPVLVLGLITIPAEPYHVSFATGLIALLSGILVFLASKDEGFLLPDGRFKLLLSWIGGRSYSIYLVHTIAFRLVHELYVRLEFGKDSSLHHLGAIVVALALVMIFAELSYRFVEAPTRRLGRRLSEKIV